MILAITYCRVYLNRQTAAAHQLIFEKIEAIIIEDTGQSLKWRHLHANSPTDLAGILQWAGDQHGGQAKGNSDACKKRHLLLNHIFLGLGLHLKALSAQLPTRFDLHEPDRKLSSLSEYEHLRRIFRLCHIHVERNIKSAAVPEMVKCKMRSLICIEHADFEGCLREIELEGGKVGSGVYLMVLSAFFADDSWVSDWVQDKRRSKFAFAGICWQQSFIPLLVWQLGDSNTNIIESLHSDANSEGTSCTLVGGVKKGQHFDTMKLRSLEVR